MAQGLTLEQLQGMGAKPVKPQGVTLDQLKTKSVEKSPSLVQKLSATAKETGGELIGRGKDIKTSMIESGSNKITAPEAAGRIVGDVAGAANDVIGGLFKGGAQVANAATGGLAGKALSSAANTVVNTPLGALGIQALKGGLDKWDSFSERYPRVAKDLEVIPEIAELALNVGVVGAAGSATKGATSVVKKSTKNAVQQFAERNAAVKATKSKAFIHDLVTPEQTKKVAVENIKMGRVSEGGTLSGRNIKPSNRQTMIEKEVASVPGINMAKTKLDAANRIHDEIANTAESLYRQIADREIQPLVSQADMRRMLKNTAKRVGEDPTMTGNAGESAKRIIKKFDSYLPKQGDITASDVLSARKQLDKWISSLKGERVFDPSTDNALTVALRATRQEANNLLAKKASDVPVKQLLKRQSLLYDAIENIAPKAAKEGNTGVMRFLNSRPALKTGLRVGAGALGIYGASQIAGDLIGL